MRLTEIAEAAKLASLALFLILGFRVAMASDTERRRATKIFIGFFLLVNAFAGISQIDNWPFTANTLAVGRGRVDSRSYVSKFYGVDANGREWPLDPLTWSPVFDSILQYWVEWRHPSDPLQQRQTGEFLLAKANDARVRLQAGRGIGFERRIGPLHAPYWWLRARHREVPQAPYVAVRLYRDRFSVAAMAAGTARYDRELVREWGR